MLGDSVSYLHFPFSILFCKISAINMYYWYNQKTKKTYLGVNDNQFYVFQINAHLQRKQCLLVKRCNSPVLRHHRFSH